MFGKAFGSAARFDRTKIDLGFALRSAAGVSTVLVAGLALGRPALGAAAAVGALSAGFASQQGVYRTRAAAMLWTSCGMALSAFAGALSRRDALVTIAIVMLWGYAYGILASLGPAATAAALNSTIALIVFGNVNVELTASAAAVQALAVLTGGVLQTALLALIWPFARFAVERRALSSAYRSLAAYARSLGSAEPPFPSSTPLATVRSALADPQPFAQRGEVAVFAALLDEAERIRGTLGALVAARSACERGSPAARAVDALAQPAAMVLDAVADALRDGRAPRTGARAEVPPAARDAGASRRVAADAAALWGQLRAAVRLAALPGGEADREDRGREPVRLFPTLTDTLQTLRANLGFSSPFGRLAVRLALTLGTAAFVYRSFGLRNGYWLALTALLLLKPDYTTTVARGVARVVGTLAGAALATAITVWCAPSAHVDVALCIVFAIVGYLTFSANYAAYTVTITAYVIFLLELLGTPEHAAVSARIAATLGGAALAGVAMLLWPTWESTRERTRLAGLLEVQRQYAGIVFGAYRTGELAAHARLRAAQSATWSARAEAEASVDRALGEPARTHALPAPVALGILAASRRIGLALLALNVHQQHVAGVPRPQLEPLFAMIEGTLAEYARAITEERVPAAGTSLRAAYDGARTSLEERETTAGDLVLPELDFIVDSVNTLGVLLGAS